MFKIQAVIAWCLRFVNNCQKRNKKGILTSQEIKESTKIIIRNIQGESFAEEIIMLKKGITIPKHSKIIQLNPWIDEDNVLRVGGRLHNANIPYNKKIPVILPQDNHITKLIINLAHQTTLHGGSHHTLAQTRNNYWIINGYRTVKTYIHACVRCARINARLSSQLMGDLPKPRINI